MGSIVSGITKIFTSIGTGIAKLGSAVRAVGATLFTASAATGTSVSAGGGFLSNIFGAGGGGGVLGNVLSGALKTAIGTGLVGGAVGMFTGEGFGQGFKQGAILGGITGGLGGLFSPTGLDPYAAGAGTVTSATEPAASSPELLGPGSMAAARAADRASRAGYSGESIAALTGGSTDTATTAARLATTTEIPKQGTGFTGLGDFLKSEGGAALIAGIGGGIGKYQEIKSVEDMQQKNLDAIRDRERRITEGYEVPMSALAGSSEPYKRETTRRPTPAQKWNYNPASGMIETGA